MHSLESPGQACSLATPPAIQKNSFQQRSFVQIKQEFEGRNPKVKGVYEKSPGLTAP